MNMGFGWISGGTGQPIVFGMTAFCGKMPCLPKVQVFLLPKVWVSFPPKVQALFPRSGEPNSQSL
jgi:hypothetical protein